MSWIIALLPIIQGEVASLRYLCISQNDNYKAISVNRRIVEFFGINAVLSCGTIILSIFLNGEILFVILRLFYGALSLAVVIMLLLSFRTKPKFTKRFRWIFIVQSLLGIVITAILFVFVNSAILLTIATSIACIFFPILSINSLVVTNPFFERKNEKFIKDNFDKLLKSGAIRIGITGSYGKTSCKNILKAILSKKYKVIATEKNFNTPMGIALTIDKMDNPDIFIAEIGARKVGDVKYICDMFYPDYSITTGVAPQHIATFKSIHNIFLEKRYLSKSTSTVSVFNGNDKYALKMYKEHTGEKIKVTCNKLGDFYAKDIVMGADGSSFTICYGEESLGVQTRLLGRHNIINITLCVALAVTLGVERSDIIATIKELMPTPHRLEYIYANGIHILDDGYNANILGVKCAMEVVDSFKSRRVVLSQGIAEGGKESCVLNIRVGREIGKHADIVILCGRNSHELKKGVLSSPFKGKIYSYSTLKKAEKHFNEILRAGDVLLIQNDLPDVY